jgi:hypothetical protein
MVVAGSDMAVNVFVGAVVLFAPLAAIAIFWFGLRSARRHDEKHGR